jgi:hypothetical protein
MSEISEKLDGLLMKYEAMHDEAFLDIENLLKHPETVKGNYSEVLEEHFAKFAKANTMVSAIMSYATECQTKYKVQKQKEELDQKIPTKKTTQKPIYDLKKKKFKDNPVDDNDI